MRGLQRGSVAGDGTQQEGSTAWSRGHQVQHSRKRRRSRLRLLWWCLLRLRLLLQLLRLLLRL
jgi:hypothetical protein